LIGNNNFFIFARRFLARTSLEEFFLDVRFEDTLAKESCWIAGTEAERGFSISILVTGADCSRVTLLQVAIFLG